jgi:hypothetical protein
MAQRLSPRTFTGISVAFIRPLDGFMQFFRGQLLGIRLRFFTT